MELKEVIDALAFRVDSILQNTQLSVGESSLPKALSTQLRFNTLLQRTSLPSSMGPVKVHLLITHYVDQNESFLFF
jgi:hypothetical protein